MVQEEEGELESCNIIFSAHSSCQTVGKWHEMHGRMPLSHGLTTSL